MITLAKVKELTNATVHCGDIEQVNVEYGFGSDLMSDVLTLEDETPLLITGLSNNQVIRTAEMADLSTILIARNKSVTEEMLQLARENDMIILTTPYSLFRACGVLFQNGLKPVF